MNASQLFYNSNKEFQVSVPPQQLIPTDFYDIPDAPVASDAPIVTAPGFNGSFVDFQPSQLFKSSSYKKYTGKPSYVHADIQSKENAEQFESKKKFISDSYEHLKFNTADTLAPVQDKFADFESYQLTDHIDDEDADTFEIPKTYRLHKDNIYTPVPKIPPTSHGIHLRSVEEIPSKYRNIFQYPYFNIVQSRVFEDIFYTDKPVVVCSPTGSGKTVVFELAIVRLLMKLENCVNRNYRIVYMAPIKALCNERYLDWKEKFEGCGVKLLKLTGDTELDDYYELQEANIILTTPEKWDSMTRRWRDNKCAVQSVCLFFIDEIHVLNDNTRGATIEAVISRMKTIQAALSRSSTENFLPKLRFVAVSATIPNIEDIAEWLGDSEPASFFKLDESLRPVRLRKVVLGFPFDDNKGSDFQFDMSLNYKLAGIINTYSEDKPTLVFCSTRKSTQQAAELLSKDARGSYIKNAQNKQVLQKYSNMVKDSKLRDLLVKGLGYHHAGMDIQDRKLIEEVFYNGQLQVLVATSTLAMGVNLPAHLVILKSTQHYNMGVHEEYSDTQVLQMIGRAGRPQFDTSATAVIMTKQQTKPKYESLLNGTQLIESSLHKHLIEHLNAEIVLHTINDISIAMEWIRYTFLYIRVLKNPKHYGMPIGLNKEQIERRLQDLCMKNLNQLADINLITMDDETFDVKPTEAGRLMARYCIAYETMKKFCNLSATETICDLLTVLSDSEEFCEISLRNNEKKSLNTLNKDKNRMTIRYPLQGKIKTKQMKVNCLIQAQLGSLLVQDFSLQQDMTRIFRAAQRIARCLVEMLWLKDDYKTLLSAVQLCKGFKARLWEDSKHVTKQLERIGPALSNALVNAGITSFQKIEETNPRELELIYYISCRCDIVKLLRARSLSYRQLQRNSEVKIQEVIVNRHPPFGNQVRDIVAGLPKYELTLEQIAKYRNSLAEIMISINLANQDQLLEKKTASPHHTCILLIGDEDNKVVYKRKIMDSFLMKENGFTKKLEIKRAAKGSNLSIDFISQDWVGLDVQSTYTPFYLGPTKILSHANPSDRATVSLADNIKQESQLRFQRNENRDIRHPCNHRCLNKHTCGHECCHTGVKKPAKTPVIKTPILKDKSSRMMSNHISSLKNLARTLPETPNAKRLKMQMQYKPDDYKSLDLHQFAYTPQTYKTFSHQKIPSCNIENAEPEHLRENLCIEVEYSSPHQKKEKLPNQITKSRTDHIIPVSIRRKESEFSPSQQKMDCTALLPQDDWTELHMFQKHREESNEDLDIYDDSGELPDPDIDGNFCKSEQVNNYGSLIMPRKGKSKSERYWRYKKKDDINKLSTREPRDDLDEFGDFDIISSLAAQPIQESTQNFSQSTVLPRPDLYYKRQIDRPSYRPVSASERTLYGQDGTISNPTVKGSQKNLSSQSYGRSSNVPSCTDSRRNNPTMYSIHSVDFVPTNYGYTSNEGCKRSDNGHRYGQVVAWTNSQTKSSPENYKSDEEWSGSDNDLLSLDCKIPCKHNQNNADESAKKVAEKSSQSNTKMDVSVTESQTATVDLESNIKQVLQQNRKGMDKEISIQPDAEHCRKLLRLKETSCKPQYKSFFTNKEQDVNICTADDNENDTFNSIFDGIF